MAQVLTLGAASFGQIPATTKAEHFHQHGRLCKGCERPLKLPTALTKTGKLPTIPPICEACRKFYTRALKNGDALSCECSGPLATAEDKAECRSCRFDRCQAAMKSSLVETKQQRNQRQALLSAASSTTNPVSPVSGGSSNHSGSSGHAGTPPPLAVVNLQPPRIATPPQLPPISATSRLDFSKIPCKVCGCSSSGIHFGVISCEGCKGFFRRSMRGAFRLQYRCKQHDKNTPAEVEPKVMCPQTSNCRQCRLKRCIAAGMSQSESAIGRLNRQQRRELDDTIAKLSKEQVALSEPVLRRQKRTIGKVGSEVDTQAPAAKKEEHASSSSSGNSSAGEEANTVVDGTTASGDGCACCSTGCSGGCCLDCEVKCEPESCDNCLCTDLALLPSPGQMAVKTGLSSSSGNSSDEDQQKLMIMDFTSQFDQFGEFLDMETSSDFNLLGYDFIPREMPKPETFNSLEMTLAPSPKPWDILGSNDVETSFWLIEKASEATARLAPISQVKIVATPEMSKEEYLKARSSSFDVYIRAISDFVTNLPGINQVAIQDRVSMFTNGFFPILIAQFSLEFDAANKTPNHFSLDRDLALRISEKCNNWHHVTERYLVEAGTELQSTVFNLKEYALLCAMLCFNPDIPNIGDPHRMNAIRSRYELALYHYLTHTGLYSPERIEKYKQLLGFFRSSTNVFQCEIKLMPTHCEYFFNLSSPLFKDFRMQFLALTPPGPCSGYLPYR